MYYGAVDSPIVTEYFSVLNNTKNNVLLIIDSQVQDYLHLLSGIQLGVRVAVLDAQQDGVKQVTEILQQGYVWEEIHLISHDSPGCLYLGNGELNLTTIHAYQFLLQRWSEFFHSDCELFIYGCQVAAGDAGKEFLSKLHQLLQVKIVASRFLTGNSALGNNLHLTAILQTDVLASYQGLFGTAN